jgi:hypothetical protein
MLLSVTLLVDSHGERSGSIRILFITTDENNHLGSRDRAQGDYFENMMLIGLRKLLGKDCVDYPRKRILYHNFRDVPRDSLHGRGFSLYHEPMEDIDEKYRDLSNQTFDLILYGTVFANGMVQLPELEKKCRFKFFIDGNDLYGVAQNNIYVYHNGERLIGNQQIPCFKGQIITENPFVFPTGVGLPESRILPIDLGKKTQLFQKSCPAHALFRNADESNRRHHVFHNEDEYYEDLAKSWFGLTCKRGGWDAMRHYEIIAAGTLALFRDYDLRPKYCAPMDMPTISYSSDTELLNIVESLVEDGNPSPMYLRLLSQQRLWLINNCTVEARAKTALKVLKEYVED